MYTYTYMNIYRYIDIYIHIHIYMYIYIHHIGIATMVPPVMHCGTHVSESCRVCK